MTDFRQITFSGRLGKDAEVKTTANGNKYITFPVANKVYYKGEEKTDWIDVTCSEYLVSEKRLQALKKGSRVIVSGILFVENNSDKSGKLWLNMMVRANSIEFQNSDKPNGDGEHTANAQSSTPAQQPKQASKSDEAFANPPFMGSQPAMDDFNDAELPF